MADSPAAIPVGRWEHFPHGADIGVRGFGPSRDAAFEQAAIALTAVVTDPQSVAANQQITVECRAPDDEALLVEWLNALVYEMATRRMLFARFAVHSADHALRAQVWGETIDIERHSPAVEVKGATYTELSVAEAADGTWTTQCIVDV